LNYVSKQDSKQTDQPKYQCEVCSYYCNSIDIVNKHISSVNHKNNLEVIFNENYFNSLKVLNKYILSYIVNEI